MLGVDGSHGPMKAEGGKVAALGIMPSSNTVSSKSYGEGEDPHVKAMLDEEFFGHDLPPNYKISSVRTPDGSEKRKESDGKLERKAERAYWDEEFLGHRLPPNYVISRFKTPEGLEKRSNSDCRRDWKDSSSGEQLNRFPRLARFVAEDTFEYKFDKTVDSYVLSEEISGTSKDEWAVEGPTGRSGLSKEECIKAETFEERALRFGVEDWNLVGKKWAQNESKGRKRSTRRGIFHSPSGSDTSSLVSTLESSSFSCGSEGSSFAKTDYSSSFNFSHLYAMAGGTVSSSAMGRYPTEVCGIVPSDGQFVELAILESEKPEIAGVHQVDSKELKDSSYLEFSFLDGKMVESEDFDAVDDNKDMKGIPAGRRSSGRMTDDTSSEECSGRAAPTPTMYQSATAQSPESENFFDSSHDSDWSGTQSVSTTDRGPTSGRETEPLDFDEDDTSNYTEDRAGEDWSSDSHFFDADSVVLSNPLSSFASKDHIHLYPDEEGKVATLPNSRLEPHSSPATPLPSSEERSARSPKRLQGASRKTRSLGSVLSHHLAFTAVPSLRYDVHPNFSAADQKESPAKVSAACIEWLWSEKGAMKPVQTLRSLAEREYAERERTGISSSPPARNLEASFRESRSTGLGRSQEIVGRAPGTDVCKPVETPVSSVRDPAKESRNSILASWAAVDGVGESARERAKRPSLTTKGAFIAPSLKQGPKRGISPRKRSVSFGPQTGSRPGVALAKPVPRNLALELEVLCRPFGPVLKGVRFLPSTKRSLVRPPLFSNLGPQLASSSSSSMTASSRALPPALKCGRLQSVLTRDGLPSYSLIMDESEEIFIAKTLRVDAGLHEGFSHLYTFHSYRGKGKGKTGWRKWGKKEKPCSDFAGNMTVISTIRPVMSCNGVQNVVESEFLLFDASVKEISISGPTATISPYPRSSFSSWDTATPQRSPRGPSSTYSSPTSTYFSLPSPAPGEALSTPVNAVNAPAPATTTAVTIPSRQASASMAAGAALRGSLSLEKGVPRCKQLERHLSLESPLHSNNTKMSKLALHESLSDSENTDEYESRRWGLPQSQSEIAAVVVRTSMERGQGKSSPSGDKWGWGINFLRKSFDSTRSAGYSPEGAAPGDSSATRDGHCEKSETTTTCEICGRPTESCNAMDQRCNSCGSSSADEPTSNGNGGLSVTLILPTGEHGCSANEIDGPQPLIERWRSGGKCDCGSWDLGCGLTIVGNQRVDNADSASPGKARPRDSTLRLYLQGKKEKTVGLALTPSREGCYSLGYRTPISPLHAFATAVAVLHSRDPIIAAKKVGESKRRLTRIPVKVAPPSSRSFSRQIDEQTGAKSLVSYKLACPNPPSSPFARS